MLRVAEQYAVSDTGRQRRANEDSLLARAPLFVVADGMGGAQAGEVASRIAVESFLDGLPGEQPAEQSLATLAQAANARIHELSHSNMEHAGMGTTLTAVYVGEEEVAIAHVGDSRAYCVRDGELLRLTDDHSLVDELMRQGRLTPEEAVEHPQRSVITRALGPEGSVEVDTRSFSARDGDVYLLCSDGLTTMLAEERILELVRASRTLREAGEALVAAANEAGGRDNITVVLLRVEDVHAALGLDPDPPTDTDLRVLAPPPGGRGAAPVGEGVVLGGAAAPAASPLTPRRPRRGGERAPGGRSPAQRRRRRLLGSLAVLVTLLVLIGAGAYLALQSVYFIGTDSRGLVTLYQGVPYSLPGNIDLYSSTYVSGVSASTLSPARRHSLLDNSLRSEANAAALIRSLELGQLE
jgi:serine/threonine protein phosphatase PrpC